MRDAEFKISAVTDSMVMIHNLYTEFVRTARFYAELLVREKFSEKKTIKVINVGGIAGTNEPIEYLIFSIDGGSSIDSESLKRSFTSC